MARGKRADHCFPALTWGRKEEKRYLPPSFGWSMPWLKEWRSGLCTRDGIEKISNIEAGLSFAKEWSPRYSRSFFVSPKQQKSARSRKVNEKILRMWQSALAPKNTLMWQTFSRGVPEKNEKETTSIASATHKNM